MLHGPDERIRWYFLVLAPIVFSGGLAQARHEPRPPVATGLSCSERTFEQGAARARVRTPRRFPRPDGTSQIPLLLLEQTTWIPPESARVVNLFGRLARIERELGEVAAECRQIRHEPSGHGSQALALARRLERVNQDLKTVEARAVGRADELEILDEIRRLRAGVGDALQLYAGRPQKPPISLSRIAEIETVAPTIYVPSAPEQQQNLAKFLTRLEREAIEEGIDTTNRARICRGLPPTNDVPLRRELMIPGPRLLAIVSDETSHGNVFGPALRDKQKDEIRRIKKKFEELDKDRVSVRSSVDFGGEGLADWLQSAGSVGPLVLVAHSESVNGVRRVRLPNGDSVSVDEIHRIVREVPSKCFILTCYGEDFGLRGKVSLDEAYAMCRAGLGKYQACEGKMAAEELVAEMRRELVLRRATDVVLDFAIPMGAGVTLYLVTSVNGPDSK